MDLTDKNFDKILEDEINNTTEWYKTIDNVHLARLNADKSCLLCIKNKGYLYISSKKEDINDCNTNYLNYNNLSWKELINSVLIKLIIKIFFQLIIFVKIIKYNYYYMDKNIISLIIVIIIIIILYNYDYIYDILFVFFLKLKLNFTISKEDIFLHNNFNNIFKNYNIENINSDNFTNNNKVNAYRNSKNEYKIINTIKYHYLATNIVNNINKNNNIFELVKLLLPHININGINIDIDQCVIIDLLKSDVQSFPSIHTDIEWGIFNNSDGFQVWYLYDNEESIGNMFLLDSEIVESSTFLQYKDIDKFELKDQCNLKIIKYLTTTNLNPKIKYLNMVKGECLIFGKNLYHMSDFKKSKYRYSINFRVIIKDTDGGIPVNLNNNCIYTSKFKFRLFDNNIKVINNKIYPKMFDLINII